ncbi:MAG: acyl-CoA dehydrogenase family protein [bacterium]
MAQPLFQEEHEIFRKSLRDFVNKEVKPYAEKWDEERNIPREVWKKLGAQGFLGSWMDEKYGGSKTDFLYSVVFVETLGEGGSAGLAMAVGVHNDIAAPYIDMLGNEEQKMKWLPGCATGDLICALGITEPGAGSDVAAIRATAIRQGDFYVINGQKTFITNGYNCDIVVLAVKTDPKAVPAHAGVSLIVVENGTPGFTKGRKLEKLGCHASDTAELNFEDCRVPAANLLGGEGMGFVPIMRNFQQERLISSIGSLKSCDLMLDATIEYARTREAFGKPIIKFQHNLFKIVEMKTEVEMARAFTYNLIEDYLNGQDITLKVSMSKWFNAELANRVAYQCVQLHGGYGYMREYAICRAFADVRMGTIAAGTTEVLKNYIGKMLGL